MRFTSTFPFHLLMQNVFLLNNLVNSKFPLSHTYIHTMKWCLLLSVAAAVAQASRCNDLWKDGLWIDGGQESGSQGIGCIIKNHCSTRERILCPLAGELVTQCGGTIQGGLVFTVGCFDFHATDFNAGGGGHDGDEPHRHE